MNTSTPVSVPPSEEVNAHAFRQALSLSEGLFAHQIEGVAFLLARRRAILADDMGLGKTRQSIVALRHAAPEGPWLVVTPASVKLNWEREIRAVDAQARTQVLHGVPGEGCVLTAAGPVWVIVNYDILGKWLPQLRRAAWAGVIFDEAHYLKNQNSARSRAARTLALEHAGEAVVYALTGTPLTNRPRDLFPLLQLVKHALGTSFLSFAKRYCDATQNGFGWVTDGASNLDELAVQLHGVMIRRRKDEVLELPPKLQNWLPIEVPENTGTSALREALQSLIAASLTQTLGSAADGPARKPRDRARMLASLTKAREQLAAAKAGASGELIDGILEQESKVIVFSCFTKPVEALRKKYGDACVVLTGSTPVAQRQQLVDRFQTDPEVRVFVANLVAGGVGLNLTAATHVVFNDLDWVPANHWQAEERAYRIGQSSTVNVHYLVAAGTLDEFVQQVLATKAALADAVVDGTALSPAASRDVLSELEAMVAAISPRLAERTEPLTEQEWVQVLIEEVRKSSLEDGSPAETGSSQPKPAASALTRYAINRPETNFLPAAHWLAHHIGHAIRLFRASHPERYGPDFKICVSVQDDGRHVEWQRLVLSLQHAPGVDMETQHRELLAAIQGCLARAEAAGVAGARTTFQPPHLHLNGAGDFTVGGPRGDNGLSGKKLVVDHYGPSVPIGGGALCGKDAWKIDRCGALRARQWARELVAEGHHEAFTTLAWGPGEDAAGVRTARVVDGRFSPQRVLDPERQPPPGSFAIESIVKDLDLTRTPWRSGLSVGTFFDAGHPWELRGVSPAITTARHTVF